MINTLGIAQVAKTDIRVNRVTPATAGQPAGTFTITINGFPTQQYDFAVCQREAGEGFSQRLFLLSQNRITPDAIPKALNPAPTKTFNYS